MLLLVLKQILVHGILLRADFISKHVIAIEVVCRHVRVAQYAASTEKLLLSLHNKAFIVNLTSLIDPVQSMTMTSFKQTTTGSLLIHACVFRQPRGIVNQLLFDSCEYLLCYRTRIGIAESEAKVHASKADASFSPQCFNGIPCDNEAHYLHEPCVVFGLCHVLLQFADFLLGLAQLLAFQLLAGYLRFPA